MLKRLTTHGGQAMTKAICNIIFQDTESKDEETLQEAGQGVDLGRQWMKARRKKLILYKKPFPKPYSFGKGFCRLDTGSISPIPFPAPLPAETASNPSQ